MKTISLIFSQICMYHSPPIAFLSAPKIQLSLLPSTASNQQLLHISMWLNVIQAELNTKQYWLAVAPWALVWDDLQLGFGCQVIPHLFQFATGQFLLGLFPAHPSLLACRQVTLFPLFFHCDGACWTCHSQGCHGYPTRDQLGLTRGPTFLISIIIPQAHLLLMSLTYSKLELYLSRIKRIGNIYCFVGTSCYE